MTLILMLWMLPECSLSALCVLWLLSDLERWRLTDLDTGQTDGQGSWLLELLSEPKMISPMRKGYSVQPQVEKSKAQLGPKIRFRFGETSIMWTTYLGVTVCQTRLILAWQDSKQFKASNMVRNKFLASINIKWLVTHCKYPTLGKSLLFHLPPLPIHKRAHL